MKIHGTAKCGAIGKKDFGVAFSAAAADTGVTWENTTTNGTRNIQTGDNFAYAQTVDSSIVDEGKITNVQFNIKAATSTGTLSCCRWDNLATMNTANAAACLSAANHTYWSIDADAAVDGMTDESVSESSACSTDETIGLVLTGTTNTNILYLRKYQPKITDFENLIHCDGASASQDLDMTATFTVTAEGS